MRNINFSYIIIETSNLGWPVWPLAVSSCLISSLMIMVLLVLKVSKSQNIFFLKLHCPKIEGNTCQNSALVTESRILSIISFVFLAMESQEKLLLRFTDFSTVKRLKKI